MKFTFVVCSLSASYVFEHLYKELPFYGIHVLYLSLSLLHAHTHTHIHAHAHTCLQRQRLSLHKLCQNSVLPQINHFLLKEANTFATWLEWAGGLCILIHEQSGEMPTLDCQHQGPFLKVTSKISSRMVWRALCQDTHLITGGNPPGWLLWSAQRAKPTRASQRECQS